MKYWVSPTQTVPFKWYCPSKNRVRLFILKTFQVSSSPSFSCNFRIVNCGRNWFVWTHTLLVLCIRLPRYYSFSLTPALLWHFSGRLTTVLQFIKASLWRYQLPPGNRDIIYLWGTGYSTKFSEWDTPLAISTLERKTLLTLSFFKIIQRQKYCLFCQNGHSQRGEERASFRTDVQQFYPVFSEKENLLEGEIVHETVPLIYHHFCCEICLDS